MRREISAEGDCGVEGKNFLGFETWTAFLCVEFHIFSPFSYSDGNSRARVANIRCFSADVSQWIYRGGFSRWKVMMRVQGGFARKVWVGCFLESCFAVHQSAPFHRNCIVHS